jgi:metal-sulfur cluster biosynthetic enzyme
VERDPSGAGGVTPELRARIDARLALVPEPCSIAMLKPVNIAQMGLIDAVAFDDGHVTVTLCLTDPACVHFRSMQSYIAGVLSDLPEVISVEVVQVTDKLWTPDRAEIGTA